MGTVHDIEEGKGTKEDKHKQEKIHPRYSIEETEREQQEGYQQQDRKLTSPWNDEYFVSRVPDGFIYRGSGTEKDSGPYTLRIENWILSMIRILIETKSTPFKSTTEFIRTSIYLFTGIWGKKLKSIEKSRKVLINIDKKYVSEQLKIREGWRLEFKASLDKFREVVVRLRMEGDYDELKDEIEGMIGTIEGQSDPKWRKKFEDSVREILKVHSIDYDKYLKDYRKG